VETNNIQPEEQQEQVQPQQQQGNHLTGTFLEGDDKKFEAYSTGIVSMIYNNDTKGPIYQMLQSGEPSVSIPKAATLVNQRMKEAIKGKGSEVDLGTQVKGVVFTTMELANLGTAAGYFKLSNDDMPPIVQSSIKEYIHSGLKDGSIDPVEAQQAAESLMTPEQKQQAAALAAKNGYPTQPGVSAALETYANRRVSKERMKYQQIMQRSQQKQQAQQQAPQGAIDSVGGTQ